MNKGTGEFLNLLTDFEDYLRTGYRSGRIFTPCDQNRTEQLESIAREIKECTRCDLSGQRNIPVPGEGAVDPLVMLIGEAPGAEEDRTGTPFVGKAGQYLDKWLSAVKLDRHKDCYIGNVVKCRPPGNRDPLPEETALCIPFLERQVDIIKPAVILTLGRISSRILSGREESLGALRGRTFSYRGVPVIPTYHPSGVLRNPEYRRPVWEDLQRLRSLLDDMES